MADIAVKQVLICTNPVFDKEDVSCPAKTTCECRDDEIISSNIFQCDNAMASKTCEFKKQAIVRIQVEN
jgi:hypothetical protein